MSTITRITHKNKFFRVDKVGSDYINHLHLLIKQGRDLALQVDNINPNCLTIDPGYLANMKDLAKKLLE